MQRRDPFKQNRFPKGVILLAVRWSCRYPLSCRDVRDLLAERGISVDPATIYRWVQKFAPEIRKRAYGQHRSRRGLQWQVDETYMRINGKWCYLWRAVDQRGQLIDFRLKHRLPAVSAQPERVVFIDETSVKTNLTRQRGWSRRSERLVMEAPFGSWGTQTFIAGLSADALIAPWVIKGAMDGEAFTAYVEQVLIPELEPGMVVILDNLATHKNAAAAQAMRDAGCWFLFLPPCSPDPNPIEMAFSKLKAHIRRIGARTFTDMFHALTEICDLFSPKKCWNYFKAAGYASR